MPRSLVPCLLASAACVLLGCQRADTTAPRNVILILVDTLRADHTSVYGYARDTTPLLAARAARGVVFERARSQASCTFPSVNSLLTSRHPAQFFYQAYGDFGIPAGIPSIAELLHERGYATVAVSASAIIRAKPSQHNKSGGFGRGFDTFDEECLSRSAACVNARALAALDGVKQPFFAYLHYMEPHAPYAPPREHVRRFAGPFTADRRIAQGDTRAVERAVFKYKRPDLVSEQSIAYLIDLYDDEIAYLDDQLQALFEELEQRGLLRDTIVVLTADHGEEFLEHGSFAHCRTLYDTETHVPLVMWLPGGPAARRAAPVENLDVVPTILDYLGVAAPGIEGKSLRPIIEGSDDGSGRLAHGLQSNLRSIDDGRYKLIYHTESGDREVFDLVADRGEKSDLSASPPARTAALEAALHDWIRDNEQSIAQARGRDYAKRIEQSLRSLGYLE